MRWVYSSAYNMNSGVLALVSSVGARDQGEEGGKLMLYRSCGIQSIFGRVTLLARSLSHTQFMGTFTFPPCWYWFLYTTCALQCSQPSGTKYNKVPSEDSASGSKISKPEWGQKGMYTDSITWCDLTLFRDVRRERSDTPSSGDWIWCSWGSNSCSAHSWAERQKWVHNITIWSTSH
jgi:hypothetical protein